MERKSLCRALGLAVVACVLLVGGGMASAGINIETVPVGNLGNAGQLSEGGFGPDRICGAVDYAYSIGKYEVTAGQYTAFLNAVAGVDTYALYNTEMSRIDWGSGIGRSGGGTLGNPYTYSVAADFVNRPVNCVSFWDSCRFANWLNNGQQGAGTTETGAYTVTSGGIGNNTITRNPGVQWAVTSEDEWYKAAYYKGGGTNAGYWMYPTRSDSAPGRDMADASGNNANYPTGSGADPIDNGHFTTVGGEFQNSASPYGTFDQGGNVWEWNEAIIYGSYRGLRGGAFDIYNGYYLRADDRFNLDPASSSSYGVSVGFRVSQVPEPASLGILGLGVVGMLVRRRGAGR